MVSAFFQKCKVDYFTLLSYNVMDNIFLNGYQTKLERLDFLNFIYTHIRKICLKNIIFALFFFLILTVPIVLIPFQTILSPRHISSPEELRAAYEDGEVYVETTFTELHDTGYRLVNGHASAGAYYYCIKDGQVSFVLLNAKDKTLEPALHDYTVRGKLTEPDKHFEQMVHALAEDLNFSSDGIVSVSMPFLLNENAYHLNFYTYIFAYLLSMMVLLAGFILMNLICFSIPGSHPSMGRFRALSPHVPLLSVLEELEQPLMHTEKIYVTKHYLIAFSGFELVLLPLEAVLWVYEHGKVHRFFLIPLKMSYTLHIICRSRKKASVSGIKKEELDALTSYLTEHHAEILIGYTSKNKKMGRHKNKPAL